MGSIDEALRDEPMKATDAEAAAPLSTQAGWNQTVEDWRFMLREGRGVGMRDAAGRWVGSSLALPLGDTLSWISMVLVVQDARRRGIGTRLLKLSIESAREAGRAAGLDATELGRPVYRPLGFRDLYTISRLRLDAPVRVPVHAGAFAMRSLVTADLPGITAFDALLSGMHRRHILAYLLQQAPSKAIVAQVEGRILGYALGRPGRSAFHVGPVVAEDETVALALATNALSRLHGPAMLDIPDAHQHFLRSLQAEGARRERGFTRMLLGDASPSIAEPSRVFALAGPELG